MTNLNQYQEEKIKLLEDFAINLKEHEKVHLMELKTEIAIDNYVKKLFMDRF